MRRLVGIVGGLLLLAAALGMVGRPAAAATPYTDPDGRFSLLVPESYTPRYRAGSDTSYRAVAAPMTTLDIAVTAQSPDPLPTPDALAVSIASGLRSPAYVQMSAPEPLTLGEQPGRRFDYYTVLEGNTARLHTLHVVAVSSRTAVVLVFAASEADYAAMLDDAAVVFASFSFTRTPGSAPSAVSRSSVAPSGVVPAATATATAPGAAGQPLPTMLAAPAPIASIPPLPNPTAGVRRLGEG